MVDDCAVKNCKTNSLKGKDREKQFIRFPSNENVKLKWITLLKVNPSEIRSSSKICKSHFFKYQLIRRFREGDIITLPQKSLPIPIELKSGEKSKTASATPMTPKKTSPKNDVDAINTSSTIEDNPDPSALRRSGRKSKTTFFADGQPLLKRTKSIELKSTPDIAPPIEPPEQIKSEKVDNSLMLDDPSETDSCDSWLIPKAKPPQMILSVKSESHDKSISKKSLSSATPSTDPPPSNTTITPTTLAKTAVQNSSTALLTVASVNAINNRPMLKLVNTQSPIIVKDILSQGANTTTPQPTLAKPINATITIAPQVGNNKSIDMVKKYGGFITARRESMSGNFNASIIKSSEKQKIVVTAQNIELLKQALSKKKLIPARPQSANVQTTIPVGQPVKFVSQQSVMMQKGAPSPATVVKTVSTSPYPINLISINTTTPVVNAPTTQTTALPSSATPRIIPAIHPKVSSAVTQAMISNRYSTSAIGSLKSNNQNPQIRISMSAGNVGKSIQNQKPTTEPKPVTITLKTNPLVSDSGKDSNSKNAKNNYNDKIIFKPAKRINSDIDLNIDLRLTEAHDLHTTQMQLNVVSRVVTSLRTQLLRQQEEQKHLREQNALIVAKNIELYKRIAEQQFQSVPTIISASSVKPTAPNATFPKPTAKPSHQAAVKPMCPAKLTISSATQQSKPTTKVGVKPQTYGGSNVRLNQVQLAALKIDKPKTIS